MRTALIALALVACSTLDPAPQVDGGIAGDAAAPHDAWDCGRCSVVVCHPALGTGCSCDGVSVDRRCRPACDDGTVPMCNAVTSSVCQQLEAPHCE